MSKNKNGVLDQYGAGPFKQQQFGTAGVEGVNLRQIKMETGQQVKQHVRNLLETAKTRERKNLLRNAKFYVK